MGCSHTCSSWSVAIVKSLSRVPTLYDPIDSSQPSSSIHGIFQARILEWVAISFSRRSSRPRDWTLVSRIVGRCFTVWATREGLGRGTRDQIANIHWIMEKAKEFQKNIHFCFIDYAKAFVWITINCGKFWKRWEYQNTWSASWEICIRIRKQQLELDMEQQTGSK